MTAISGIFNQAIPHYTSSSAAACFSASTSPSSFAPREEGCATCHGNTQSLARKVEEPFRDWRLSSVITLAGEPQGETDVAGDVRAEDTTLDLLAL